MQIMGIEDGNVKSMQVCQQCPEPCRSRRLLTTFLSISVVLIFLITFSSVYLDFNWVGIRPRLKNLGFTLPRVKPVHTQESLTANTTLQARITQGKSVEAFVPDPLLPFSDLYKSTAGKPLQYIQLFVAVFTAPLKFERRKGIRETWWKACIANPNVKCLFFTDSIESIVDATVRNKIIEESKVNKDIIFMPIGSGILFGHRFLYILQYGSSHYTFDYFMRLDDDFLLCLDHFLWDLQHFPKTNVHWGYLHCSMAGLVYIDEGITMFSFDLVRAMLSQKSNKMLCHPFGDQTYTIWLQDSNVDRHLTDYAGNNRIHHDPPAARDPKFKTMQNICHHYLALHGIYDSNTMIDYYNRRGNGDHYSKFRGKDKFCPHEPVMLWRLFGGMYHAVPKLCSSSADWPQGKIAVYPGRE